MNLSHKVGPLPLWGWGAVAVVGVVVVRGYLSAGANAEVSTDGEPPVIGARFETRRPSNLPVPVPAAGTSEDLGASGGSSSGLLTAVRGPGGLTSTEGASDGSGGGSADVTATSDGGPFQGTPHLGDLDRGTGHSSTGPSGPTGGDRPRPSGPPSLPPPGGR